MKISDLPNMPISKRKPIRPEPKKAFKEVYKAKEKPKESKEAAIFQPSPFEIRTEISLEESLMDVVDLIQTHIETEGTSTSLTVNSTGIFGGTEIVIETDRFGPGSFHIELLTHPDALALIGPNLDMLEKALKKALPHITCHLAQPALLSQFGKRSMLGKKSEKRANNDCINEKDRIDYYRL